jgi:hypothetical protein
MIAATDESNKRLFRDRAARDRLVRITDSADLTVTSPELLDLNPLLPAADLRRSSRERSRAGTKISFATDGEERPEKWQGDTWS